MEKNFNTVAKKSKIVDGIMKTKCLFKGTPQRVKPGRAGVHSKNRKGQMPNMQYIYNTLNTNVKKDGYCTTRAKPGIVVRYLEGSEKLKKQRDHQNKIAQGAIEKWPPLNLDHMFDFTLAFTHMNIKLRLHEAKYVDPISGTSFVLEQGEDPDLDYVVDNGHEFVVLDGEQVTDEDCMLISDWYNADQDQNNSSTEASLINSIKLVCKELTGPDNKHVKISSVVQKVAEASLVKVKPGSVASFTKWCLDLGGGDLVDEWLTFHSVDVDSTSIASSPNFFEAVSKILGVKSPLLKLNISEVVYDPSVVDSKTRPIPDAAQFVTVKDLEALGKDPAKIEQMETFMRENRVLVQQALTRRTSHFHCLKVLRLLEHNVVRLGLGKPLLKDFDVTKIVGKWDASKLKMLQQSWMRYLQKSREQLADLGAEVGVAVEEVSVAASSIEVE